MIFNIEPSIYKVNNDNQSLIYGETNYKDLFNIIEKLSLNYNITTIIDVGSGCGNLLIYLASKFDDIYFEGIEIQKNRYDKSIDNINKYELDNICIYNDSFINTYLGNFDLLFCCNTIFCDEDNDKLYNKIINEFSGIFILFTMHPKILNYFIEETTINTSWCKKVNIFIYKIN